MDIASAIMVAWLETAIRPGPVTEVRLRRFLDWVDLRKAEGAIMFEIKMAHVGNANTVDE